MLDLSSFEACRSSMTLHLGIACSVLQILEIKRLNDALANTRSEVMRTEERLEDAKKLQKFLRDLTPQEWTEGLIRERDDRHALKMAAWQAECSSISEAILVCFSANHHYLQGALSSLIDNPHFKSSCHNMIRLWI